MFGTYRLLLALAVAMSHVNIKIHDFNPGIVAVIGFYLISGYVMTGLIRINYSNVSKVLHFFIDRALRLFPQYLAVLLLSAIWFALSPLSSSFASNKPTGLDFFNNLLIIPLNYFGHFTLIPTAWSLGLELQFYVLLPFILYFAVRRYAMALSALVFFAASVGLINTDLYGYHLLPGVLFIFLTGSLLYDVTKEWKPWRIDPSVVTILLTTSGLIYFLKIRWDIYFGHNREVLFGFLAGSLILILLSQFPRKSLDEFFGNLSYGVFLNHSLVLWAVFGGHVVGQRNLLLFLALSILLSFVLFYAVERTVLSYRKKLRAEQIPKPVAWESVV